MPIYEYACKKCGSFEVMQRISEEPLKKCPTCGARVSKLISRSAFHLKGSGWYTTDYARSSAGNGKTDDSKPAASEAKENSASSTSSSASAKESKTKESPTTT
jgi:putative FmdB family regulatory protein